MKKNILSILLITTMVSAINVDAISVFGKDLNFGKLFNNKAKSAAPISAVVDSKVNFEVTFPKKDSTLTLGEVYNITWKTNDKIDSYTLTLDGSTNTNLGKAYNAGKTYSWLLPKDVKPGNYKLVFTDKYGNKYKSNEFKIKGAVELQSYKIESAVGTPVEDKTYFNVDYKITSSVNPIGEFNIKLNCPSGVSAVQGQDRTEKCNKIIAGKSFSKSVSNSNVYNITLSFTNKNKTSQLVTAELFANGKSYGKGVNMVEATKVVVTPTKKFIVTFPTAGAILNIGQTYNITWDGDQGDLATTTMYQVILVGDGYKEGLILGTAYGLEKSITWSPQKDVLPGKYKLIFSGKAAGGSSEVFTIAAQKETNSMIQSIYSTATVVKNNNIDTGVNVNMKFNFTASGSDIYAIDYTNPNRNMTAIIGLRDLANKNTVIATSKPINVSTLEQLTTFPDGSTRQGEFSYVFPISSLSAGVRPVQAYLESVNYTPVNSATSKVITTGLGVFNTNSVTIDIRSNTLNRDLLLGSVGDDVVLLKKFLVNKGFMDASDPTSSTNYFGVQTLNAVKKYQTVNGISPADGYVGPMTRISINSKIIVITER